uniref:PRA1 family protein n=1 Tax=Panstrongylus lignarius TaxID=156445 RepID=A0A224XKJ7_9HEMI
MYLSKLYAAAIIAVVLAIMADVSIDITGTLSSPVNLEKIGLPKYYIPSVTEFVKSCREKIRPWKEFFNTSNYKAPPNFSRLIKRAVNNINHFQGNYVIVSLILMAYCLLTSPLLLISIFVSLIACYILSLRNAEKKLKIGGKDISLKQQYSLVGLFSLPLYYWAGVGQAVFWVLGATCFVVSLHAGMYSIEDVLTEEEQLMVQI